MRIAYEFELGLLLKDDEGNFLMREPIHFCIKTELNNLIDFINDLLNDDLELTVRGGGGTRFEPPFNLFNDHSDDVDDVQAIVYFTDGWGEVSPEVEPDVPVFWAVTEKSSYSENLAFGEVVYVETADFYH